MLCYCVAAVPPALVPAANPLPRSAQVICFGNFNTALQDRWHWDPSVKPKSYTDWAGKIDDDWPAFFGVDIRKDSHIGYNLNENQVFATEKFVELVQLLHDAQDKGEGLVVQQKLTTVPNSWYGVSGGLEVEVMWIYMGRAQAFEAALQPELRKLVTPSKNAR